jgi:hypothetical protein
VLALESKFELPKQKKLSNIAAKVSFLSQAQEHAVT